jgi:hypothetical protein
MDAVVGATIGGIEQGHERVNVPVRLEENAPAAAAITAIRPTEGYEFLAAKTDASVAAVSGADVHSNPIDELFAFHAEEVVRGVI